MAFDRGAGRGLPSVGKCLPACCVRGRINHQEVSSRRRLTDRMPPHQSPTHPTNTNPNRPINQLRPHTRLSTHPPNTTLDPQPPPGGWKKLWLLCASFLLIPGQPFLLISASVADPTTATAAAAATVGSPTIPTSSAAGWVGRRLGVDAAACVHMWKGAARSSYQLSTYTYAYAHSHHHPPTGRRPPCRPRRRAGTSSSPPSRASSSGSRT